MRRFLVVSLILLLATPLALVRADPPTFVNITITADAVNSELNINADQASVVVDGVEVYSAFEQMAREYEETQRALATISSQLDSLYKEMVGRDQVLANAILDLKAQVDSLLQDSKQTKVDMKNLVLRTFSILNKIKVIGDDLTKIEQNDLPHLWSNVQALNDAAKYLYNSSVNINRTCYDLEQELGRLQIELKTVNGTLALSLISLSNRVSQLSDQVQYIDKRLRDVEIVMLFLYGMLIVYVLTIAFVIKRRLPKA